MARPLVPPAACQNPDRVRAANINPVAELAADYLNHYNEVAMLCGHTGRHAEHGRMLARLLPKRQRRLDRRAFAARRGQPQLPARCQALLAPRLSRPTLGPTVDRKPCPGLQLQACALSTTDPGCRRLSVWAVHGAKNKPDLTQARIPHTKARLTAAGITAACRSRADPSSAPGRHASRNRRPTAACRAGR